MFSLCWLGGGALFLFLPSTSFLSNMPRLDLPSPDDNQLQLLSSFLLLFFLLWFCMLAKRKTAIFLVRSYCLCSTNAYLINLKTLKVTYISEKIFLVGINSSRKPMYELMNRRLPALWLCGDRRVGRPWFTIHGRARLHTGMLLLGLDYLGLPWFTSYGRARLHTGIFLFGFRLHETWVNQTTNRSEVYSFLSLDCLGLVLIMSH